MGGGGGKGESRCILVYVKMVKKRQSLRNPLLTAVSIKHGLRTTYCGLGIKYGLGIKRGLADTDWV